MIDTTNKFLVSVIGDNIVIINTAKLRSPISGDDALNLAAYLVSMAESQAGHSFEQVLEAVTSV